jgi:hypothetical protein
MLLVDLQDDCLRLKRPEIMGAVGSDGHPTRLGCVAGATLLMPRVRLPGRGRNHAARRSVRVPPNAHQSAMLPLEFALDSEPEN